MPYRASHHFERREEKQEFIDMLHEAARETVTFRSTSAPGMIWNNVADLRMIHCLTVDSVKESYLQRNNSLSRLELDRRNGPTAIPRVEVMIASHYNDETFRPRSLSLPNLHDDFLVSMNLSLEIVPCTITPDQVSRWLADRKAKLVLIINKWEKSGNGSGNRKEGDDMFGQPDELHEYQDDDNRANFLGYNRSSLLYYWHMAIQHEFLSQTVNILPTMLSATTDSTSPVSRKSRGAKKRKVEHESSNIPQELVDGFKSISRASNSEEITNCEARIEKAERSIEAYIKKLEDCEDGMLREFYEERLTAARIRLSNSTAEYEKLYA